MGDAAAIVAQGGAAASSMKVLQSTASKSLNKNC